MGNYIFCLMGKSASGKDTIYKRLLEKPDLPLQKVVPYTTRPIRDGEQDGVDYHFCSNEYVEELKGKGKIIELRGYDTVHGLWQYFTADDGQICLEENNYLLIGTLEVYIKLQEYFGKEQIVPLFISLDDGERLQRALNRERMNGNHRYAEMCRRFLADEADFSLEKMKTAGIAFTFENKDLNKTVEEISAFIVEKIGAR